MLEKYQLPNGRGKIFVLNDGLQYRLGSKQRVAGKYVQKKMAEGYSEFIYSSSSETAGGYALAQAATESGAKAALFMVGTRLPPQSWGLTQLVHIELLHMSMEEADRIATEYVLQDPRRLRVPFGIHDLDYTNLLRENLRLDPDVRSLNGKRIWITAGSGTLLSVLLEILPESTFLAVQVGKAFPDFGPRVKVYYAPEKFTAPAEYLPPWRSLANYDAKSYRFILQDGQDGDAIWIVM